MNISSYKGAYEKKPSYNGNLIEKIKQMTIR